MQRLTIDPRAAEPSALRPAVEVIARGGVVAFPTDTLYGLAVDPRQAAAVARLYAIKSRSWDQPVPLIAADLAQVERDVGHLTPLACRLAARFWPGPLTLIVEAPAALVPVLHAGTGGIGVRVPRHAAARALAEAAAHPLTATSANRSGQPPASTADQVAADLGDAIDLLIDGGPTPGGPPSTVVDVRTDPPELVRAGAVPWERVLEFLIE